MMCFEKAQRRGMQRKKSDADHQDSGLRFLKRHPDERDASNLKNTAVSAENQNLRSRPEHERQFRQHTDDESDSGEDRGHVKVAQRSAEPVAGRR